MLSVLIFLFPSLYGEGYDLIQLLLNGQGEKDWFTALNHSLFYGHNHMLLLYLALVILFKVFATTATNGGGGCGEDDKIFTGVEAHENLKALGAAFDASSRADVEQVKFRQFQNGGIRQEFSQIVLPRGNFFAVADEDNRRTRIFSEGGGDGYSFLRTGEPVNQKFLVPREILGDILDNFIVKGGFQNFVHGSSE